jgi:hypothetical protein
MTVTPRMRAMFDIEDDLILVEASAGVMHLAYSQLEAEGKGGYCLARSLFFTARSVEAACDRIRAALDDETPTPRIAYGRAEL